MEKVARKPHFDDLGDLVVPPLAIDSALSEGVSGAAFPVVLRPHITAPPPPQLKDGTYAVPPLLDGHGARYADISGGNAVVGVVVNPQAVQMFRNATDGALPLPLDLDNEYFLYTPKAPNVSEFPQASAGSPVPDALRATWGDMLSEDGSNSTNVVEAYNTLLHLNPDVQYAARAARNVQPLQATATSAAAQGVDVDSESLSSAASSVPYPYPFPSFMYSAKPPPRLGLNHTGDQHGTAAANLALIGQTAAVHLNPAHQKGRRRQDIAAAGAVSLLEGSDLSPPSLVRRSVGNAEVFSRPPATHDPQLPARLYNGSNEQDDWEANSLESRGGASSGMTMPAALSSAVVQRGSKTDGRREAAAAGPDYSGDLDSSINTRNSNTINADASAVVDRGDDDDAAFNALMEREMEDELRQMLRGYSDQTAQQQQSRGKQSGGNIQQGLPKIGQVAAQNAYSTPILALASPNTVPDLNRSSSMPIGFKPGSGLNKVGALAKSNTSTQGRPSKALATAGSSSMSSLPHLDDIRVDVAASVPGKRRYK